LGKVLLHLVCFRAFAIASKLVIEGIKTAAVLADIFAKKHRLLVAT